MRLLFILVLLSITGKETAKTDLERTSFKGPVKSVTSEIYKPKGTTDKIAAELSSFQVLKYNREGYENKMARYNLDMSVRDSTSAKYDKNSNKIEYSNYNTIGVKTMTKSKYDKENNLVYEAKYDSHGELVSTTDYSLDDAGRPVSIFMNFVLFKQSIKHTIAYDDANNTETLCQYDENENLKECSTYVSNDQDKLVEITHHDNDGALTSRIRRTFEEGIDEMTKESRYNSQNEIEEYTIYIYDEEGELLSAITYDRDETILKQRLTNRPNKDTRETISLKGESEVVRKTKRIYKKYDQYGNWLERDYYVNDKIKTTTKRVIEYYKE